MKAKILTIKRTEWELLRGFNQTPFKKRYQDILKQNNDLKLEIFVK